MVVARADVGIPAKTVAFSSNDQRKFAVGLQSHDAVGNMHAMFFKDTGQSHIVAFIKSGTQLDQAGNLLSGFRRVDQALDERGVAGGSVQRLFDGHHFVVVSGITDEPFDGIVEAFVGVMHEEVAIPDGREHLGVLSQPARYGGRPFFALHIRTG